MAFLSKQPAARWAVLVLSLLLIAASRVMRLDVWATELRVDEVWSVWQTFGTPDQIIRWTPYDWPPLYYLALGAWQHLVGIHPIVLRFSSLLCFMVGASALYRVMLRLKDSRAALLAMLAYGAISFNLFLSIEMRGYALLLGVTPLTLLLALRWLDRPLLARLLPLALCLAAMFYTSLTASAAIVMLVLFTLFVYGWRAAPRWIVPGVIALALALPELVTKFALARNRVDSLDDFTLAPIGEALFNLYRSYFGYPALVWALLIVAALVLAFRRDRPRALVGLVVWSLMPIALYITSPIVGFFQPRYSWWVMLGVAMLVGWGLSALPRVGRALVAVGLAGMMFLPIPLDSYQIKGPPIGRTFDWLSDHVRWGDVFVLDPNCDCIGMEQLDYYTRAYFPDGLRYVDAPGDARRVWYIAGTRHDPATDAAVQRGRVRGEFFGTADMLAQVYEAPPDAVGVLFENGMRFHGAEIVDSPEPLVLHEGESIRARLWWSVDAPPPLDYSVGVYLFNPDGSVVAQDDSAPRVSSDQPGETSRWQTGAFYIEERTLALPFPTARGDYRLGLAVYFWEDQVRLRAPGVDADGILTLREFFVMAW